MHAPTVADTPMISLVVDLLPGEPVAAPYGTRHEIPFEGTATSPLWHGEWRVTGIDHITRGSHGTAMIDVHVTLTDGTTTVLYRGHGRGGPNGLFEGVTFETASEEFGWLNDTVAVGVGGLDGATLTIELYQVS